VLDSHVSLVAEIDWDALLLELPPLRVVPRASRAISQEFSKSASRLVVVDDDPTGSQGVRDVMVLTRWEHDDLFDALVRDASRTTFVLTNTRSLSSSDARRINEELGARLATIAHQASLDIRIVSRGDSTLRGHFPAETDALISGWERTGGSKIDGVVFCPAFIEAGRVTIGDTHWVRRGERAIPVGLTEFAEDPTFGFHASDLPSWIADHAASATVTSISIEDIRMRGPSCVFEALSSVTGHGIAVVNAADRADLDVFVLGLSEAEGQGKRFIYRTGPSFVPARTGQSNVATLTSADIYPNAPSGCGLLVVGSHSDVTNKQLECARSSWVFREIELDIDEVLAGDRDGEIARVTAVASEAIEHTHVALVTSRARRTGASRDQHLALGRRVSNSLVDVVREIEQSRSLQFIIAKGGITAADLAVDALHVRRAHVVGPLLPGQISLWRLPSGLPFVVFPGNVGSVEALSLVIDVMTGAG
jgi:uncharacterized protein YgbK (DUF1537 family)